MQSTDPQQSQPLLSPGTATSRAPLLHTHDDPTLGRVIVPGAVEQVLSSAEQAMDLLLFGEANRLILAAQAADTANTATAIGRAISSSLTIA